MATRGGKRRLDRETLYWELVRSGVGTGHACREAGMDRKTGFRWRQENGGLPPSRLGEDQHCGRYLSQLERQRIASLHERGHGVQEIARRLSRSPSTISRELRRDRSARDRGGYDGDLAHARARERARRPKVAKLATDPELRAVVASLLELEWSPEQIAVHLRTSYPGRTGWHLCAETIYQALYLPGRGGLPRETYPSTADRPADARATTPARSATRPLRHLGGRHRHSAELRACPRPSRSLGRRPDRRQK